MKVALLGAVTMLVATTTATAAPPKYTRQQQVKVKVNLSDRTKPLVAKDPAASQQQQPDFSADEVLEIEGAVGTGVTMIAGIGLVALSLMVMLKVTPGADPLAREDLAFALSVVLLGLLMMVTRRNAVSQVVGFMSLENGLVLAATGARGMPLVVEISVTFSIVIAFIVIGILLFRIR